MNTIIEDKELNSELQELYIIASHWLTDLKFFRKDLCLLKTLYGITLKKHDLHDRAGLLAQMSASLAAIEKEEKELATEIAEYLVMIGAYLNAAGLLLDLRLITSQADLESRMNKLLQDFKLLKKKVFRLHNAEDIHSVDAQLAYQ